MQKIKIVYNKKDKDRKIKDKQSATLEKRCKCVQYSYRLMQSIL